MQYKTNQLEKTVLFSNENFQHITQDFWVYKFTTVNPSYQYSLIDDLKQDLPNVKSVVYLQGKAFYTLFEKAKFKNDFELEDKIKSVINNSEEVQFSQITNLRDENEIDKCHLAQLLFNSLANTSSKNAKCSNITGSLYWVIKAVEAKEKEDKAKMTWQYITLKLELDYHLHLKIEVKTFSNLLMTGKMNFANRKTQLKDYLQYEILSGNIRSMRRLKSKEYNKKPETTYILAQADGKKSTVSFLDFSDWNSFEMSKSGVLYLFLKEVQEQLSKYITIKFVELPFSQEKTEFDKQLSDSVKAKIKEFYQNKPIVINIADSLKDNQEAKQLAQDLQTFLTDKEREYKAKNVTFGNLSESALNIRIIRSKENYDEQNDEHCNKYQNGKYRNFLVHHITTDDFDIELEKTKNGETKKILSNPAIDVILKESYIKNDIKQGKITILDWTFGEWLFMGKEEIKEENQSSKDKKYAFHLLKVLENGNLEFTTCLPDQVFSNSDYERLKSIYQTYDKFNGREFLNCLLVSNHQDVNLIFETPRFTIQEIEKIGEKLELEAQETELQKSQVLAILEKFVAENQSFASDEKLQNTINHLKNFRDKLSKDELNNIFKEQGLINRTKIKKAFCDFYYQNSEQYLGRKDVLHHFFKGKEEIEELFASNTNIYYQNENATEAFYFVGVVPKQIQTSFQNATNIRKIKAVKNLKGQQSRLVFDQLLQTMAVDFVKQGSLTVLPFPFKYLREIQK
ncbi:hypothetical protein [Thermoflexibacter ruber]|uniref:Uncharacterized protein n=1 Tax=Thermoflexibacter ruber TaxID=1003 RepID=A0A1I2ATP4_9BACT|nr:hypothetical protein [Thermoflexibacter ruber]SFE47282.1 hypothetical protein SAMN04488541_10022 [Thermoflexibacter ruber]